MIIIFTESRNNITINIVWGIPEPDGLEYRHKCYVFMNSIGQKPVSITSLLVRDWERFSDSNIEEYVNLLFDNRMPFVISKDDEMFEIVPHDSNSEPLFNYQKKDDPFITFRK